MRSEPHVTADCRDGLVSKDCSDFKSIVQERMQGWRAELETRPRWRARAMNAPFTPVFAYLRNLTTAGGWLNTESEFLAEIAGAGMALGLRAEQGAPARTTTRLLVRRLPQCDAVSSCRP